jgi:hypothetical protein
MKIGDVVTNMMDSGILLKMNCLECEKGCRAAGKVVVLNNGNIETWEEPLEVVVAAPMEFTEQELLGLLAILVSTEEDELKELFGL